MTFSKKSTGDRGEDLAAQYLQAKGYAIVERNWRLQSGEIDLIALKDSILVFCEVKSSRFEGDSNPELRVDRKKQIKIAETARQYMAQKQALAEFCRFDVIAVKIEKGREIIQHIENAFWPPDDWN